MNWAKYDYGGVMERIRAGSSLLLVTPSAVASDAIARGLAQLDGCERLALTEPGRVSNLDLTSLDAVIIDARAEHGWLGELVRSVRGAAPALPLVLVVENAPELEEQAIAWGADECCGARAEALATALKRARARRHAADQAARASQAENERARTLRLRRHNDVLRALARQLTSSDLLPGLRAITEAAAESMEVTRVSVWLLDAEGGQLRAADVFDTRTGEHSDSLMVAAIDNPEYFVALENERVIAADDVHTHPSMRTLVAGYMAPLGIVSALDAPIRVGNQLLGVVCHEQAEKPRKWTDEDHAVAGRFADFVALAIESHEHKRAEEALRTSNAQLEDARRIEAVGRLAGGVAHDFNNVITVVSSYAFLLARKLDKNDPLQGPVAEIGKAAERAADITRKLLALSRHNPVSPRVFDLNSVVRGMETFLRRLIGEHIALELALSKQPLMLRADPGQIEQIVLNLVVNARDAAHPEGGNVILRTYRDPGSRRVPTERPCVLEVIDTGVGMNVEVQARIFEPFFTTKEVGKGSGLGLFTVWGTITQMGATIEVKSEPAKGSRFILRFAEASPEVQAGSVVPERSELMGKETILLVEDEPQVREVTGLILTDLGYRVLEAENIEEAIAHAKGDARIDLLVSDIVMPKASGPVVAARLKELIPELRVLFISGYSKDMLSAYDASLGPTLPKPFTVEQIGKKVREVLDKRRPRGGVPRPIVAK